jgi:hypothetical protein
MWKEPKLGLANLTSRGGNLLGFNSHMLFVHKDGEITKIEGETLNWPCRNNGCLITL